MNEHFKEGFEKEASLRKAKNWITAPVRKLKLRRKLKASQKAHQDAFQKHKKARKDLKASDVDAINSQDLNHIRGMVHHGKMSIKRQGQRFKLS